MGPRRVQNIINSSKLRGDKLHTSLEPKLSYDADSTLECHKDCVSTYTSKSHIKRHVSISGAGSDPGLPESKRSCRSSSTSFDFQINCLFCGEVCQLQLDPRHPERWNKVIRCATAEQGDDYNFKKDILKVCNQRGDTQADEVRIRIQGAISDLHAADAVYHKTCHFRFMSPRNISVTQRKSLSQKEEPDKAFDTIVLEMQKQPTRIWNAIEIHSLYQDCQGIQLSRRALVTKLVEHFGKDLLILSGNGVSSLLVFRSKASNSLRLIDDDEDELHASIECVAKEIQSECKELKRDSWLYDTRISLNDALTTCSTTLLDLLKTTSIKLDATLTAALVGNIVTSQLASQATTLQIALGIFLRDKHFIQQMSNFNVCCSYDEVVRFKASAASAASEKINLRGLLDHKKGLVQAVADNLDADISTANGLSSTHALAMLMTQTPLTNDSTCKHQDENSYPIKRLRKEDVSNQAVQAPMVQRYNGPTNPVMPAEKSVRQDLSPNVLASQIVSLHRARDMDFEFLRQLQEDPDTPEHGGFNTWLAREQGHALQPATTAVYTPLIDMTPADPDTMMTAMVEAQHLTAETGQAYTIFTSDLQLYRVMVDITWVYPDMFSLFIPRLGGMHLMMSYIGSVGALMSSSGLEEILSSSFGGVAKMLSGKKFPQNYRALRILAEELLCKLTCNLISYDDLMQVLEDRALQSRTSKLWVDSFLKPVFIMMLFVRAEREGDWPLHIWCVTQMLPYFFAAGHINYAR